MRRRQLRQQAIRLHKAVQRVGAALHHAQASAKIANGVFFACHVIHAREQAAGDGLDGRQRIGKLMPQHADEALPCGLLFFLQRQADIGKQKQRVRAAVLAESRLCGAASAPAFRRRNGWIGRAPRASTSSPVRRAECPKQRA